MLPSTNVLLLSVALLIGACSATSGGTDPGGAATGGNTAGMVDAGGTGGAVGPRVCELSGRDARRAFGIWLELPDGTNAADQPDRTYNSSKVYTVTGTIGEAQLGDFPCQACTTPTVEWVRVDITDDRGDIWKLGTRPVDGMAAWLQALREIAGSKVSLTVSYIRKFEAPASAGLTLTDGDGPVLVVNRGPHVDTTEAPEGVRISRGPAMCSGPSSCYGTSYALTFEATTTATVYLAEDGDILFGDRPFTVRNLGEVQPVYSDECTHSEVIESGTLWALWRKPRN